MSIERLLVHLTTRVYADRWTAQSGDHLCRRIKQNAKTFGNLYFSNMFDHFKKRIVETHLNMMRILLIIHLLITSANLVFLLCGSKNDTIFKICPVFLRTHLNDRFTVTRLGYLTYGNSMNHHNQR
jgi:hypothetical protein